MQKANVMIYAKYIYSSAYTCRMCKTYMYMKTFISSFVITDLLPSSEKYVENVLKTLDKVI